MKILWKRFFVTLHALSLLIACDQQMNSNARDHDSVTNHYHSSSEQGVTFETRIVPSAGAQIVTTPTGAEYSGLELSLPPGVIAEATEVKIDVMLPIVNGETVVALNRPLIPLGPSIRVEFFQNGQLLEELPQDIEIRFHTGSGSNLSLLDKILLHLMDDSQFWMVHHQRHADRQTCDVSMQEVNSIPGSAQVSLRTRKLGVFGVSKTDAPSTPASAQVDCKLTSKREIREILDSLGQKRDDASFTLTAFQVVYDRDAGNLRASAQSSFPTQACDLFVQLNQGKSFHVQADRPEFELPMTLSEEMTGRAYISCKLQKSPIRIISEALEFALPAKVDTNTPAAPLSIASLDERTTHSAVLYAPVVTGASTYLWTTVQGPENLVFESPESNSTMVSARSDGRYLLRLTASNQSGESINADFVLIWDTTAPMISPLRDILSNAPIEVDPIVSGGSYYSWSQISGPGTLSFSSAFRLNTTVSASQDGDYVIALLVRDAAGNTAESRFKLTWDTLAPGIAPVADIHTNRSIVLAPEITGAMSFSWTEASSTGQVQFTAPTAASTSVMALQEGSYTLKLTATDALGQSSSINIQFTWDQTAPTIEGANDFQATGPLTVSPTVAGAEIYEWVQVGGPGNLQFSNPNSREILVSASMDGGYTFDLYAKDRAGNQASARFVMNWDATPPQIKLAPSLMLGGLKATLHSTVSGAQTLQWSFVSGPGTLTFSNSTYFKPTVTVTEIGSYRVRLTAVDQIGHRTEAESTLHFDDRFTVSSLAGRNSVVCAILKNNSLRCWGAGLSGQLGLNHNRSLSIPDAMPIDLGEGKWAVSVAPGSTHTCAILNEGSVKCWGAGDRGQLGYGNRTSILAPAALPIDLGEGKTAMQLALGSAHSCAILNDHSVKCWGNGTNGQLGYGGTADLLAPPASPIDLGAGRTALHLSAGDHYTCAVLDDGSIKCWGLGSSGQLGYGNTSSLSLPALSAINLGADVSAKQVAAANSHTCALLTDGTVKCWGAGGFGQLGYGTRTSLSAPGAASIMLGSGRTALQIAVGLTHSCAPLDDASVKCWGIGRPGQLGYGPTNDLLAPAAEAINLGAGKTAVQLAIGTHFSCALLNDESVKCWGSSEGGVLGLGHFSALTAPGLGTIEFGADKSVMMLAAGSQHTCAYLSDETVKCWGHGTEGQLGYGDNKTLQVPGTGSINLGSGALPFKMVASNHTCVRFSDSKVNCWGPGYEGQLGYGNTNSLAAPSLSPINFSTAAGAIDIAVGGAHTCAILQDYSVRCWGEGGSGQLGYGSATRSLLGPTTSPVALGAGKTAKRIVAGAYHTCALLNDNSVKCWGSGQKGQLGTGVFGDLWTPPAAPVDFGIERTAVSLVAGHEFTCALLDDATVRCWGDGSNGQLGVGYFSGNAYRVSPQTAINFGQGLTARSITAGWHHACAILNDSSLKCWGDNSRGQLGYGNRDDYFTPNYIPVNLGSGVAAVQAVAGGMHSCAVLDNQTAKCWGEAAEGQLGIKDITVWAPLERSISYEPMIF